MGSTTPHYNLFKPAVTDSVDVVVDLGNNFDLIDSALYSISQSGATVTPDSSIAGRMTLFGFSVLFSGQDHGQIDPVAHEGSLVFGITGPPLLAGALNQVVQGLVLSADLPATDGLMLLEAHLYVTDLAGTQVVLIDFSGSHTGAAAPAFNFDIAAGTPSAIAGTDLVWDGAGATVTSTAGGVFVAHLRMATGWD